AFFLIDAPQLEVSRRGTIDDRPAPAEARAMAGAVPGAFGRIPGDVAAEVCTGWRESMQATLVVAESRDLVAPDAGETTFAGRKHRQRGVGSAMQAVE